MTVSRHPSAQIDALTKGVPLPLPAIQPAHLQIILEVLAAAVEEIFKEHAAPMHNGDEAEINALLDARLCNYLVEPDVGPDPSEPDLLPIWRQIARSVTRGKETIGYDGKQIELRPDLNILLIGQHPAFPLIVECKIIDPAGGKTVRMYLDNGVCRFLDGRYGWALRDGIILAYVRDGSTAYDALTAPMAEDNGKKFAVLQLPETIPAPPDNVVRSVHRRGFSYPGRMPPTDDPGPITLRHLWVQLAGVAP